MTNDHKQSITDAQKAALKWLIARGGDGVFDKTRCLIAAGERAGVMRSTWARLEHAGMIERYHGGKRARITDLGLSQKLDKVQESDCA